MEKEPQYIILNFLHGNGPYLRTIELALAVNDALEDKGYERKRIIVPLVYGDRQKRIMEENFGEAIRRRPREILLERKLGSLIQPLLYSGNESYNKSLKGFLETHQETQGNTQKYIDGGLKAETFAGLEIRIAKNEIALEINRCPQLNLGIERSYYTGFDYISKVLEHALRENDLEIDRETVERCIPLYNEIEKKQTLHFVAEPSIFSYLGERKKKYVTEVDTPPNTNQIKYFSYAPKYDKVEDGAYVTITGIPGLEHLFRDIKRAGMEIYTHRPELIQGSRFAPPDIIANKNIKFHFARSGWGSLWLSLMTDTPFIARPYKEEDDFEIYFNNKCIEHLGIGKVFKEGETLDDLMRYGEEYKRNVKVLKDNLIKKYNTLNGVKYTAEKIVEDLCKNT